MAWDVNQIFLFVQFLTRKNQSNSITANDFFYVWNAQSAAYMQDMLGRFQRNANTKEGANTGAIENETVLSKLAIFTKNVTINVVAGNANKPADFTYAWALRETSSQERIWPMNYDQIYFVKKSVIDPPSTAENNYYCTEYQNYYSILPTTTPKIDLDYCSSPVDIVWGWTLDANNRKVYNPGTSVQPQWTSNGSIIEITQRTLKLFGVSYQNQDMLLFGESIMNKGN